MSRHVLVGFGYTALFLAKLLVQEKHQVLAISRKKPDLLPNGILHLSIDIANTPLPIRADDILYYFVPPLAQYNEDELIKKCLHQLPQAPKKIIYIGSSGVYGQQNGDWVDEDSTCHIETPRQQQRMSAEQYLENYCQQHQIPCARLRTAGIYGPKRIPQEAVLNQTPIISTHEAPFINHIYVKDLAKILSYLGTSVNFHGVVNVADGHPQPMGTLQNLLAKILDYPQAPQQSFASIWEHASEMKKEFMCQNKRLNISVLQQILSKSSIHLHQMEDALIDIIKNEKNYN